MESICVSVSSSWHVGLGAGQRGFSTESEGGTQVPALDPRRPAYEGGGLILFLHRP